MKIEDRYLSDEELEKLIFQIEQNEMVSAPSGFMDEVLEKIGETKEEKIIPISSGRNKKIEFQKYCIRVITSVAAAIALVFLTPEVEMVRTVNVPTRQEVVGEIITREEALDNTGHFEKLWNQISYELGGLLNETTKKE